MRGEHLPMVSNIYQQVGSSPHAWGTHRRIRWEGIPYRFIPTCVGNTYDTTAFASWDSVHPHMRGEHEGQLEAIVDVVRFIPTCVGNTTPSRGAATGTAVHPHMRGEHERYERLYAAYAGSSPHAWGTRIELESEVYYSAVHPHMRGEHGEGAVSMAQRHGSSPHAWGTPFFGNIYFINYSYLSILEKKK